MKLKGSVINRRVINAGLLGLAMERALWREASKSAAAQEPEGFPYVVAAEELAGSSGNDRFIDVSPLRTYRDLHIVGAIHGFWRDTVDREYPFYGAVVTQGENERQRLDLVSRYGIDQESHVVVYDDQSGFRAARIVWFLRFLGFPNVALLDGGLAAWEAAGLATSSDPASVDRNDAVTVNPQEGYYLVTRQLIDRIDQQRSLLIDTRTAEERLDDLDGQLRLGTIPGSVHLPWTAFLDEDGGHLREPQSMRAGLANAGIDDHNEIVVFARFGVDAAFPWLALKNLGFSKVVVYDRGWVEWASRDDLPITAL